MSDGMASVVLDTAGIPASIAFEVGVSPGVIVAGFDVHRRQFTFDAVDTATGELLRGRIDSTPDAVEQWVGRFPGRVVHVAVGACTGWLFVARALERCGAVPHLTEPVETTALRGRKRRAKTDRMDARWLRQLLQGRAVAGVVDAARAHSPMALPRWAALHAGRRADQLDPAGPRGALPPRDRRRPESLRRSPAANSSPRSSAPATQRRGSKSAARGDRSRRTVGYGLRIWCAAMVPAIARSAMLMAMTVRTVPVAVVPVRLRLRAASTA